MVPADSRRIPRAPRYSGAASQLRSGFGYGAFTLYGPAFQPAPLPSRRRFAGGPTTPGRALTRPVWAPPRSLAATCGITFVFSSSGYLDVSVPLVGLRPGRMAGSRRPGCPIRTSRDQCAFAAPPRFSQLVASFVASESQGILHAPFSPFLVSFKRKGLLPFLAPLILSDRGSFARF